MTGDNRRFLAITRKGDDARRPPAKSLQSIGWKPEPRGPGNAERMLADAEGERLELLAYTFVAENLRRLYSGFEIFARDYRGRFFDQVAAGEAAKSVRLCVAETLVAARLLNSAATHGIFGNVSETLVASSCRSFSSTPNLHADQRSDADERSGPIQLSHLVRNGGARVF